MNTNKIINTIVLVCVISAIIAGLIQSDDKREFVSGFLLGEMFMATVAVWVKDFKEGE